MELIIKYYKADNELHIEDYHYHSCTYVDIKTPNEIAKAVEDFIYCYNEDLEEEK